MTMTQALSKALGYLRDASHEEAPNSIRHLAQVAHEAGASENTVNYAKELAEAIEAADAIAQEMKELRKSKKEREDRREEAADNLRWAIQQESSPDLATKGMKRK